MRRLWRLQPNKKIYRRRLINGTCRRRYPIVLASFFKIYFIATRASKWRKRKRNFFSLLLRLLPFGEFRCENPLGSCKVIPVVHFLFTTDHGISFCFGKRSPDEKLFALKRCRPGFHFAPCALLAITHSTEFKYGAILSSCVVAKKKNDSSSCICNRNEAVSSLIPRLCMYIYILSLLRVFYLAGPEKKSDEIYHRSCRRLAETATSHYTFVYMTPAPSLGRPGSFVAVSRPKFLFILFLILAFATFISFSFVCRSPHTSLKRYSFLSCISCIFTTRLFPAVKRKTLNTLCLFPFG